MSGPTSGELCTSMRARLRDIRISPRFSRLPELVAHAFVPLTVTPLGVFRPLLLSLTVRAVPATSRCQLGSCRCTFWAVLGYGRPPDLDAKESGGSGGSFVAVREPPRRHGHINRSVCINVSVACIPCCILSCGGMCKEARTHDRRVWAGWLRACQLAHFRCARGP